MGSSQPRDLPTYDVVPDGCITAAAACAEHGVPPKTFWHWTTFKILPIGQIKPQGRGKPAHIYRIADVEAAVVDYRPKPREKTK